MYDLRTTLGMARVAAEYSITLADRTTVDVSPVALRDEFERYWDDEGRSGVHPKDDDAHAQALATWVAAAVTLFLSLRIGTALDDASRQLTGQGARVFR